MSPSATEREETSRDDPYVGKLIAALDNPEPMTRVRAAWILGRRADPSACAPLVASLAAHADDPEFLATAAWSLGQIGDPAAVPALIDLARRSFLKSRLAAVEALARWPARADVRRTLGLARHDRSELVREAAERLLATTARAGGRRAG